MGVGLAEMYNVGVQAVIEPSFIKEDMMTSNEEFAKGWLHKAKQFMTEHKRKPKKNEVYNIFIDTYMEL